MEYKEMMIPFELPRFNEMNKKQAEQYFNWFMEIKEKRLDKLQKYIADDAKDVVLDMTPESLINLWKWFQERIKLERKTDEELQEELRRMPEWMRQHILDSPMKFTYQTRILAYDIAVYFGDVVIANNPQIKWGYLSKPKRLHGVNQPRLLGFAGDMSVFPYGHVQVMMRDYLKKKDDELLYSGYLICKKML